jgi:hypothetical protein
MEMEISPLRCLPPNLINPFLSYRALPVICAILLLALTWVFFKTLPKGQHGMARRVQLAGATIPSVWVVILTIWVWLQSFLFFPECGVDTPAFGMGWLRPVQHFDRAFFPPAIQVTIVAAAVIALVLAVAVADRLMSIKRAKPVGG